MKKQNQLTEELNDQWIDGDYDSEFRAQLMNAKIRLRFVRLPFENRDGEISYSTFVTNLSEEDFDTNGII